MKMSSLNLPLCEPEVGPFHRNGDCRCGRRHASARSYAGYSWCLVCEKLQPVRIRPKKKTNPFPIAELSRKVVFMVTPEEKAVAYLRQYLKPDQMRWVRGTMVGKTQEAWFVVHHHDIGRRIRNALRRVGYTDRSFEGGSLDDVYFSLLHQAVANEEEAD